MKLNNCEIRPGVVVTADDPKKMGRIKAVVPGWFNNASMHEEDMFWIAPFTSGSGYQRVSKCIEGQKVWILHDSTNEYEYYYITMWETNINTTAAQQDFDYDVLVSRSGKSVGAQMFYTGNQGFVTRIGEHAQTQINQAGDIESKSNGTEISIRGSKAFVGLTEKCEDPIVRGNKLYKLLSDLKAGLDELNNAANGNPYTVSLCPSILKCSKAISDTIDEMNSKTSFVSE